MKTRRHAVAFLRGITLAVALSLAPAAALWADSPKAAAPPASMAAAQSAYGHLPLSFEANQGQTDSRVNYLARGHGYMLLLTPNEALLALRPPTPHSSASPSPAPSPLSGEGRDEGTMLRLQLLGAAHTSTLRGVDELPGKANYFIGNNPETWRTNVPTFAKVAQPQVYPGIDVIYYGNPQQLEFDFIVAPGADPQMIRLKVDGADRLEMDAHGDLLLHVLSGDIQLQHPRVYQEIEGVRTELSGHYVVNDAQEVSFQVASYDTSRPLVIDPTLVYSTYLGGRSGDDEGSGIAVDAAGNAYVTGFTTSSDFPTASPLQATNGGSEDAFVTKIGDPSTNQPPVCSAAVANPASLWTPNGQFVPIVVTGVTDPDGDSVTITVTTVTQDEPVKGKSDKTSPDAVIQAGSSSVRAERLNSGNGRVYQISFRADDGKGGSCTGAVKVGVPISLKKGLAAIDDGQIYDSTVP
jgi:hypothetical protein